MAAPRHVPWPDAALGTWVRVLQPDPRLLFRFSALTFNAHRIQFRGVAPLFDLGPIRLLGVPTDHTVRLEAQGPDGRVSLEATATLG